MPPIHLGRSILTGDRVGLDAGKWTAGIGSRMLDDMANPDQLPAVDLHAIAAPHDCPVCLERICVPARKLLANGVIRRYRRCPNGCYRDTAVLVTERVTELGWDDPGRTA